jgi:GNAT superfamily N-acetyltransferase
MIDLAFPHRHASPDDDLALAELINFAGEGMPHYLWERMREEGETAWDVGCRRARRDEGSFSWRNAILAEIGGEPAALIIGYPLPGEPEPIDRDAMPAMFVPLQELENLACGSWYVNVLAAYPTWRGQGLGSGFLKLADRIAKAGGHNGLSIIVSDANAGARRLYERCGYRDRATRPMVKEDWLNEGDNWVLMTKGL